MEIRACNLKEKDGKILVEVTDAVSHALEEEDWDEERWEGYREGIKTLQKLAEKADKVCVCPPHGLRSPPELIHTFKECVKNKNSQCAERNLKNLALCILGDI